MRTILLRILPYGIAFAAGLIMYALAELYTQGSFKDLMLGVASGLLSIPLVFIAYELVKAACTAKLNNALFSHLSLEAKRSVNDIAKDIMGMLPSDGENLRDYVETDKREIKKRLNTNGLDREALLAHKNALDKLFMGNKNIDIIPQQHLHQILEISKQAGIIYSLTGEN